VGVPDVLHAVDLFSGLSLRDLGELCRGVRTRGLSAGETICAPGQDYEGMFVVAEGCVEVQDGATSQRLGSGDSWGELNLIARETTTCVAWAATDTQLLELDKDSFDAFVSAHPSVMRDVLAALSRRAVQANQRLLADDARVPSNTMGSVYAVFSTRGGSGKTLIATRLALELTRRAPGRVALFDLDLLFNDGTFQLGASEPQVLAMISSGELERNARSAVSRLMAHHESGLALLVASTRPEDGERVTAAHVRAALNSLRTQYLATIIDCPGTYADAVLAAIETANRVVVVCTPELTTLRDVREMQRLFGQALHVGQNRMTFVLNHPSPVLGLTRRQFESALQQRALVEIEYAGPAAAHSKFANAIRQIAAELGVATSREPRGLRIPVLGGLGRG